MKRIAEFIVVMLCLVFCGFAVQSETDQRNNRTECIISLYEQKDIQCTETELLSACISSTNIQEISDLLSINKLKQKNNGLMYTVVLTENGFYYIVGDSIHLDFRRVKFSEDETLKAISLLSVGENIHDVSARLKRGDNYERDHRNHQEKLGKRKLAADTGRILGRR